MDTIKTAVVVVLLLTVLYGVYLVLNKPDHAPPPEVTWGDDPSELAPPDVSFDAPSFDTGNASGTMADDASAAAEYDQTDFGNPIKQPEVSDSEPPVRQDAAGGGEPPETDSARSEDQFAANDFTGSGSRTPVAPPDLQESSDSEAESDEYRGSDDLPDYRGFDGLPADSAPAGSEFQPAVREGVEVESSEEGPEDAAHSAPGNASPNLDDQKFQRVVDDAQAQIDNGNYREALFTLSLLYTQNQLTEPQREELHNWLDPLAGRVIYSTEHLLAPAHEVQSNETLSDIANKYRVPWELLRNINRIEDPTVLSRGSELKVLPGPFSAEVDLTRRELRLFVGGLYAGRFPVTFGNDPVPAPGSYSVKGKQQGRTFYGRDGQVVPAGDPQNPYGEFWLDLGGDTCIHGSPVAPSDLGESAGGCISLSPIDAKDVFEILSPGSKVTIR